jgi:hypothetical protein
MKALTNDDRQLFDDLTKLAGSVELRDAVLRELGALRGGAPLGQVIDRILELRHEQTHSQETHKDDRHVGS